MGNEISKESIENLQTDKTVGFDLPSDCVEITHKDLLTASQELQKRQKVEKCSRLYPKPIFY